MQSVLKLIRLVCIAHHLYVHWFFRFQQPVFLNRFEYGLFGFLFSECVEICFDHTFVLYVYFKNIVFQDCHISEIQFFYSHFHDRTNTICHYIYGMGIIVLITNNINCQRKSDFTQFFSEQRNIDYWLTVLFNLTWFLIYMIFSQNFRFFWLRQNLKFSLQRTVICQNNPIL